MYIYYHRVKMTLIQSVSPNEDEWRVTEEETGHSRQAYSFNKVTKHLEGILFFLFFFSFPPQSRTDIAAPIR